MSHPELKKPFPKISEATFNRDIRLLKETGLIKEKKESRIINGISTRKVFIFFKDDKDIIGRTKRAMENLKQTYSQVTLDLIASRVGLPPDKIQEAAYTLAAELNLPIGKKESLRAKYT